MLSLIWARIRPVDLLMRNRRLCRLYARKSSRFLEENKMPHMLDAATLKTIVEVIFFTLYDRSVLERTASESSECQ